MAQALTAGSCELIFNSTPDDVEIFEAKHVVQFLSIKKFGAKPGNSVDRYKLVMSDGVKYMQVMLATPLNHMIESNTISRGTIARVEKLSCNYVQDKKLVIILKLEILVPSMEKIGDPSSLDPIPDQTGGVTNASTSGTSEPQRVAARPAQASGSSVQQAPPPPPAPVKGRYGSIYPIEGLSPFQNNWTIKARVIQKSDMKTWSNARGEGKLFNVTLMDDTGEIRGTAFNVVADELYPKFEEGKVYYISKARVNLAQKKFSSVANDYEMSFERNTEVEECLEVMNIPKIKYNFVLLDTLESLPKDAVCDVIGVVKVIGEISHITSQKQQREIVKRDLTIIDQTQRGVRLTLWGKHAEQFAADNKDAVIAFKGVKVGDFGGRTLSMLSSSTMEINPDIEECFALRGWYDSEGSTGEYKMYSGLGGSSGGVAFNRSQICSLDHVKQTEYGLPGKPETFSTRATIMKVLTENLAYPACPATGCKNKKLGNDGGSWRCPTCDLVYTTPEYRYIISMAVADHSGQAWFQGFNDVGNVLFEMPATDLMRLKDEDEQRYEETVHSADGMIYNFACRAKQDTFNDVPRMRYGISRVMPVDYKEEGQALRDLLYSPWAK